MGEGSSARSHRGGFGPYVTTNSANRLHLFSVLQLHDDFEELLRQADRGQDGQLKLARSDLDDPAAARTKGRAQVGRGHNLEDHLVRVGGWERPAQSQRTARLRLDNQVGRAWVLRRSAWDTAPVQRIGSGELLFEIRI